mgnify:CR=1 FL=1
MHYAPPSGATPRGRRNEKIDWFLVFLNRIAHAGDIESCINGVNLKGQRCASQVTESGNFQPQQVVATGYDAMEIILNPERMATGIGSSGNAYFVGPIGVTDFQGFKMRFSVVRCRQMQGYSSA